MRQTTLLLPGLYDSGPDHWQTRWEHYDARCRRVVQTEWSAPRCADWVERLDRTVRELDGEAVLVGHSTGLPFASIVVASDNDPYVSPARAAQFAAAWGSRCESIGQAGHINAESALGLWPFGRALLEEVRGGEPIAPPPYYHGTRAALQVGDLIAPGYASNYGQRRRAAWVYLSATMDAATWGAELAHGSGRERIYVVEPTGLLEHDPNLTNARFAGNPTRSYRTRESLRVVGEETEWTPHAVEQVEAMRAHVARLAEQGIEAIED